MLARRLMFAHHMALRFPPLLLLLALLTGCGPGGGQSGAPSVLTDSIWDGEMQVTGQDARFMACGSGIRYAMTGPGMDSTLRLYDSQRSLRGQTMKVWLTGHLAEQHPGTHDTAFVVARIEHIDATLSCPPRPNRALAGRYEMVLDEPQGRRVLITELFPNGEVLNTAWLPGKEKPFEMDGTWGVNSAGEVVINWPQLEKKARYGVTENTLTFRDVNAQRGVPVPVLHRTGPADRMGGAFGRVVRWMAAVSARHGGAVDSTTITLATPLGELVTTPELTQAMTDSAVTWFPLSPQQQRLEWPAMSTVGDMVALKRSCDHTAK